MPTPLWTWSATGGLLGELKKGDGPDWMDVWGQNLFHTATPTARRSPALAADQRAGAEDRDNPAFLNYLPWYKRSYYLARLRSMYGVLGLLDIIPMAPTWAGSSRPSRDFGMAASQTSFHGFYSRKRSGPTGTTVGVSYYRPVGKRAGARTGRDCYLGTNRFEGRVTLDAKTLGLAPQAQAARLDAAVEPTFDATNTGTDSRTPRQARAAGVDPGTDLPAEHARPTTSG